MIEVLNLTFISIATGLIVSGIWMSAVWYCVRRPGESWEAARKREMRHLDRLAELDAIQADVRRGAARSERNAELAEQDSAWNEKMSNLDRIARNAELAEIPDTVRSFDDRGVN